ncbi:efflux transporter outer membrane subunit [Phenylobacterium sp.]|uniref:efflux transporter outer membrane subunit n=1 Tax=Phenylobacterium sp. TaxID=1871053 RepID=UPI0025D937A3|nr:efflux transporter outer membrane subunit [Phenylobacterium sp.]
MPLSNRLPCTAVALALALGGCAAVGPEFRPPAAPAGPAGAGYAMVGDPAAPGARLDPEARSAGPWWEAFGDPDLDRVVRQALAESPSVAEAGATLARYQAEVRAARGAQAPEVTANGSAQRERINTQAFGFNFPTPTITLYSIGAGVSYDLDLFGGKRRATEAAQARADQAARQADAAFLALSGNVALQAMRVAGLRARIAAVEAVIADDRRTIDMVRKAEALGGQAPSAITGGRAQLAEDEALLPPLQRELDMARHQLALLVGKSPAEWSPPDFDMARLTAPAEIPLSLPSTLVRRRPDILAAEAELHAATAEIGVAVAAQYPDIRLSATLTQSTMKPEQLFNYSSSGWNLLSGVTSPVFDGGRLKAERRAAEATARVSLARYQQTVLRAFVQVSDALAALGSDQQRIAALGRAGDAATARVRDAEAAYRLGGGALIQVVDAQRQLSRARQALAEAQAQRFADLVELYAATATDWRKG